MTPKTVGLAPEPDEPQRLPPAAERGAAAVYALDDSQFLNGAQAQALVRVIEAAPDVKRRYHFFVWMQSHVHVLLPHLVAICGAYERQRRELVYEAFHSVPLPPTLLQSLANPQSAWIVELGRAWVAGESHALVLSLAGTASLCTLPESRALIAAGLSHIAVHGVARPQRPDEIECLFLLAGNSDEWPAGYSLHFELLLPHLQATYLRVQNTEREMGAAPKPTAPRLPPDVRASLVTARERQILHWVREGKSNQQIGEVLGISALTVKNHVQKILRKLGASNRAQAVALAIATNLLASHPNSG